MIVYLSVHLLFNNFTDEKIAQDTFEALRSVLKKNILYLDELEQVPRPPPQQVAPAYDDVPTSSRAAAPNVVRDAYYDAPPSSRAPTPRDAFYDAPSRASQAHEVPQSALRGSSGANSYLSVRDTSARGAQPLADQGFACTKN